MLVRSVGFPIDYQVYISVLIQLIRVINRYIGCLLYL